MSVTNGQIRIWRSVVLLWILFALGIRFPLLVNRRFDIDEMQHLHGAYCIASGLLPYRDYFEHHTPWLHYLLTGVYWVWGDSIATIYAARALMLSMTVCILYLTYRLGRQLYGKDVGLLSALFLAYVGIFVDKTLEIRPDVPELICWLAGLVLLVRSIRADWSAGFGMAGAFLGGAVMFSQKALFGIAGLLLALVWVSADPRFAIPRRRRRAWIAALCLGGALPVLVTAGFFAAQGALEPFFSDNFIGNLQWKYRFAPDIYIDRFVYQNPIVSVLGLCGWVAAAFGLSRFENVERGVAVPVAAALSLAAGLFAIPVPHQQYFLPLLPLWAIFAASLLQSWVSSPGSRDDAEPSSSGGGVAPLWLGAIGWVATAVLLARSLSFSQPSLLEQRDLYLWLWGFLLVAAPCAAIPPRRLRALALGALVVAGYALSPLSGLGVAFLVPGLLLVPLSTVLPPRRMLVICLLIGTLAFPLDRMRLQLRDGDPYLLDEIRFVLETTPSDAKVLTGWRGSGVFRRHAYFYFFLHPEIRKMLTRKQRGEDVVRALEAEEPELVVYDRAVQALRPEVTEYIRRHYRPTGVGPLLRRIDQSP